ncbi:uncharacterized protein LOC105636315 isoform X2 [Jatropha curcas]|nr:uncharacterized protein LOC105636315 isoform X2 [Jatropha curcas]
MFNLSKKRKLQAEQFGLPMPKLKCWDHRLSPKSIDENQEVEDFTQKIQENAERHEIDDGSDPESAKDSNSFIGDSDSATSLYYDSKLETEISKEWPCNGPSSSSFKWGCHNLEDPQCPLYDSTAPGGTGKGEPTFVAEEHYPLHKCNGLHQNFDDAIGEFESHSDYTCSEHGTDSIEPFIRKELDDILYPKGVDSNVYVLSSGRWNVNQDAQPVAKKPTIDQEFEQYFSMLML